MLGRDLPPRWTASLQLYSAEELYPHTRSPRQEIQHRESTALPFSEFSIFPLRGRGGEDVGEISGCRTKGPVWWKIPYSSGNERVRKINVFLT